MYALGVCHTWREYGCGTGVFLRRCVLTFSIVSLCDVRYVHDSAGTDSERHKIELQLILRINREISIRLVEGALVYSPQGTTNQQHSSK
jgi:hypothetical protein